MILAIDIGNSNIVMGAYLRGEITVMARTATSRHLEADQYAIEMQGLFNLYKIQDEPIEGAIISSVVPSLTPKMVAAIKHFTSTEPHLLSLQDSGEMMIDIENPTELGMDILASAIAVRHSMPLPAVVIDMGTATKLTALDAAGTLRGVSIAPGLFVSMEALVGSASLLQGIALDKPPMAIGRNSTQSMQSGLLLGAAAMLDGMIDRFEEELGTPLKSIMSTGGAAPLVVPYCRRSIQHKDTLLLDGLFTAYGQLQQGK